jgi:hypothetical protein
MEQEAIDAMEQEVLEAVVEEETKMPNKPIRQDKPKIVQNIEVK